MKLFCLLLLLAIALVGLAPVARSTTYTWYGDYYIGNPYASDYDNNWNNPFNWFPHSVPGPSDTVIIADGTVGVFLNVDGSVSNVVFGTDVNCAAAPSFYGQGHVLHLYGQFTSSGCGYIDFGSGGISGATTNATLSGTLTLFSGGSLSGTLTIAPGSAVGLNYGQLSGSLTVSSNAYFAFGSGLDQNIPGAILNNYGTVTWTAGRIRGGGLPGSVINNYGLWDCQADLVFNSDFGGDGAYFINYGTFRKSGGTNSTAFGPLPFYNYGNVDVETGTVEMDSGGVLDGGVQTGNGTLLVPGGSLNLDGFLSTTNLKLAGANSYGPNVINGGVTWSSGLWNGAASILITSNSVINVVSAADHDIAATVVTNLGTVSWIGPGRIRGGGVPGTAIYNYGLWDSRGDWALNDDYAGDGTTFYNYGTLCKSAGVNSTTVSGGVYVYNTGTLDLESGTLSLNGGGWFAGGAQTGPGTLAMAGGGYTLNGMTTTTNALLSGGILYGNNVVNGGLNWVAGDWVNATSVTITTNSFLFISSGADHNIGSIQVTNFGYVAWSGGRVRGGGVPGSFFWNYGTWDSQGDLTFNDDYTGDGTIFYNFGIYRKSAGTTSGALTGINFQNYGLLDLLSGSIAQSGGFYSSGAINTAGGTLSLASGGVFSGGTQTGAGTLQLAGGSFNLSGIMATNVLMTGGTLSGSNLFNGTLNWAGGDWSAASSVTLGSNSIFTISSAADHNLAGCSLNNYGSMTWVGGGRIRGGGIPAAMVNNYGLWDSQGDLTFNDDFAGAGTIINNYGTYRKSVGTGLTTFTGGVYFGNTGTIDIETGNVAFNGGFANSGTVNIVSGYITLGNGGALTGGVQTGAGLLQMAAGSFTDNGMVTTTNLEMAGGVLYGTNVFTSGLTWAAGNWNSASSVTIPMNTVLYVISVADHDMANCTLNNYGAVAWTVGRIRTGGNPGSVINNYGLWDSQSDLTLNTDYALNGYVFNNYGTFLKSGGQNSTTLAAGSVGPGFRSSGTVNITTGTLSLNSGGTFSSGSVTGNGLTALNAGIFTINNTTTTTNTWETGGNLGASVINGGLTWSSGLWNNAGTITMLSNSLVKVVGGADHDMANCVITNRGTVAWSGGRIRGGSNPGTTIYNFGTWDSQGDLTLNADYVLNGVTFNNFGTLQKSSGTSATTISPVVLKNQGFVQAFPGGYINLSGGGTFSGGFVSGQVILAGGNYNINGSVTSTNVFETGSLLVGSNVLAGGLTWSGGNWNSASSVTIASNTEVDITSAADHDLANCAVRNNGRVEWLGGRIRGGSNPGSAIYNNGIWDIQCDYALNSDYALNGVIFQNAGKFRKFATTGSTTISSSAGLGVAFTNPGGTIELDSGTLVTPTSFPTPASGMIFGVGGTNAGQWGKLVVSGVASISGPLTVFFTNNFQPAVSNQFTIISSVFDAGAFSSTSIPQGFTVNYTNTSVFLIVTSPPPVQLFSSVTGTNLLLSFNAALGQGYTIQTNNILNGGTWLPYEAVIGSGGSTQFTIPVIPSSPQLFFRVSSP